MDTPRPSTSNSTAKHVVDDHEVEQRPSTNQMRRDNVAWESKVLTLDEALDGSSSSAGAPLDISQPLVPQRRKTLQKASNEQCREVDDGSLSSAGTSLDASQPVQRLSGFAAIKNSSLTASLNAARKTMRDEARAEAAEQYTAQALEVARVEVKFSRDRATAAATARKWRSCEEELTYALNLVEGDASLFTFRSFACLKQNKTDRALSDAERALKIDPSSSHAHYRAGRALTSRGRYSEAGETLCRGLGLTPRASYDTQTLACRPSAPLLSVCLRFEPRDAQATRISCCGLIRR